MQAPRPVEASDGKLFGDVFDDVILPLAYKGQRYIPAVHINGRGLGRGGLLERGLCTLKVLFVPDSQTSPAATPGLNLGPTITARLQARMLRSYGEPGKRLAYWIRHSASTRPIAERPSGVLGRC